MPFADVLRDIKWKTCVYERAIKNAENLIFCLKKDFLVNENSR